MSDIAKHNTRTPGGHPEGYLEAFANIYAEVLGGMVNCGGHRMGGTITAPNPEGVMRCVRGAVADAIAVSAGGAPAPGTGVAEAHRRIRAVIATLDADREMGADIAAATRLVRTGALVDLVDG